MSPRPALSVLLVNYNTTALTRRCVDSLRAQNVRGLEGTEGVEILVVDNASRPEERHALTELDAVVLYNQDNRGYGAALNQACAHASSEFILFSNSDTWYFPGSLQSLLDALQHLPQCGAVGPKFWWDLNREFLLPPSDAVNLLSYLRDAVTQRWPYWQRRWRKRAVRYWQAREPLVQDMLSGACILTRRDVVTACGGFDERFHLYYEDTDWCRRVRQNGYRLYYVPEAEVVHMYNQSARQQAVIAQTTFATSADTYFRKHYGVRLWRAISSAAARLSSAGRLQNDLEGYTDLGMLAQPPQLALPARTQSACLLQFSSLPSCIPAIACFLPAPVISLPLSVWEQLGEGEFFAQLLSLPDLRLLGKWRWQKTCMTVAHAGDA